MFTFDGETEGANCMPNILEVARQIPEFALTVTLIERAELTDIFSCPGPFTGNLPSNAAWDDVDPAFLELLLRPDNVDQLEDLLLFHFLPGRFPTTSLAPGPIETLLPGESVSVSVNPIAFNGVEVGQADIQACNGLLNELRSLLIPFGTRKYTTQRIAPYLFDSFLTPMRVPFPFYSNCVAEVRENTSASSCSGDWTYGYF